MNYRRPRILIVDNYDSFTFNLVQILREYDRCDFDIEKNDRIKCLLAPRGMMVFSSRRDREFLPRPR